MGASAEMHFRPQKFGMTVNTFSVQCRLTTCMKFILLKHHPVCLGLIYNPACVVVSLQYECEKEN